MSTVPRVSGISDFADNYLGIAEGADLAAAGPASSAMAQRVGHDAAAAIIATAFWQSYLRCPAFDRSLAEVDLAREPSGEREILVVGHPLIEDIRPRYSLIVLDSAIRGYEPTAIDAEVSAEELALGWELLQDDLGDYRAINPDAEICKILEHVEVIAEASEAEEFRILFAALPESEATAYPSPAWTVRPIGDEGEDPSGAYATAGLLDTNADGVLGVTIPNHLLAPGAPYPVPIGMPVTVNGMPCAVVSSDVPSDSCFVRVPTVERAPRGIVRVVQHVSHEADVEIQEVVTITYEAPQELMSGLYPRQGESAIFEGALSGRAVVRITAWNPDLLIVLPHNMCKFFTEAQTGGGDSGAALRDAEGRLLGFAFGRTKYGETPEYSSWIWAESVARAHNLRVMGKATPIQASLAAK